MDGERVPKHALNWALKHSSIFKALSFLICTLGIFFHNSHAENFRAVSKRGDVRIYYTNGEKVGGGRGESLEEGQRWVVGKNSGLFLQSDLGSKISIINSGVIYFNRDPNNRKIWTLEVSAKDLYVSLSARSNIVIETAKARCEKGPSEFYYEDNGRETSIRVLQGEVLILGEHESEIMKTMVVRAKEVNIEPFQRSDFFRVQRRHENNMFGREPERASIIPSYPLLPWRASLFLTNFWTHLLPANSSSFAQDRFGFGLNGQLSKDFLLRRPPSPAALSWMPRLRLGSYLRIFRPRWKLSTDGKYQPLGREFGLLAGLAWDGFFLTGNGGFVDFSSPFKNPRPLSWGGNLGFEYKIRSSEHTRLFWDFGLYFQHIYVMIDENERQAKSISDSNFRSISYGFLTGPSLAF